ncbi:MAG: hypothetical protein ACOC3V_02065 [bacterium]
MSKNINNKLDNSKQIPDEELKKIFLNMMFVKKDTPKAERIERDEGFRGFKDGYKGLQENPPLYTFGDLIYEKGYELGERLRNRDSDN